MQAFPDNTVPTLYSVSCIRSFQGLCSQVRLGRGITFYLALSPLCRFSPGSRYLGEAHILCFALCQLTLNANVFSSGFPTLGEQFQFVHKCQPLSFLCLMTAQNCPRQHEGKHPLHCLVEMRRHKHRTHENKTDERLYPNWYAGLHCKSRGYEYKRCCEYPYFNRSTWAGHEHKAGVRVHTDGNRDY